MEDGDTTIREIPKLSSEIRVEFQQAFTDSLIDPALKTDLNGLLEQNDNSSQLILDLYLKEGDISDEFLNVWEDAKVELIKLLVHEFRTNNSVELKDINIWKIDSPRSVKKVAESKQASTDSPKIAEKSKTKRWWKFW